MPAPASVGAKFRLCAKKVFLTYAQCPLSREDILTGLQLTGEISSYIIAQELHQDGHPHIHAMIEYKTKLNIRNARHFDIQSHHPKVEPVKKPKECYDYCKKDDATPLQSIPPFEFTEKRKWSELNDTTSKEEFMATALQISPRDYYLNLERLEYAANKKFKITSPPFTPKYSIDSFIIPHIIKVWQDQFIDDRPKSLLIIGDSRLGKTQLIRTLYPTATYWYSMINLDTFNRSCPIVIFDDFEWDKIPCKKGWLGAQSTIVVSDKYRKKQTIEWGRPCVILTNDDPVLSPWERANLLVLKVRDPLFKINS